MPKKKLYLSASRIKTLEECSWKFHCKYNLKLPDGTNSGALRGTICHLIFELLLNPRHKKHFDSIIKKNDISGSEAITRLVIKYLEKDKDIMGEEGSSDYKENYDLINKMTLVGLKLDFFGDGGKIDGPEQKFVIQNEKPKYNVLGFIDKPIQYKKDGIIKVVDYKSSKSKFSGEELTANLQAMIYSLAAKRLWPEIKRVVVQFMFLRFPRKPIQELEFSEKDLKGLEHYLEYIYNYIETFDDEKAKSDYAADKSIRWMCGPAKSGWICPFHKPFKYYALLGKDREVLKSSHDNDLEAKDGQTIEEREYDGCPRFNGSDSGNDPFNL